MAFGALSHIGIRLFRGPRKPRNTETNSVHGNSHGNPRKPRKKTETPLIHLYAMKFTASRYNERKVYKNKDNELAWMYTDDMSKGLGAKTKLTRPRWR